MQGKAGASPGRSALPALPWHHLRQAFHLRPGAGAAWHLGVSFILTWLQGCFRQGRYNT